MTWRLEYIRSWRQANREHMRQYNKQYHARPENKSRKLFLAYGITLRDHEEMVEAQSNQCLICQEVKPLVVDHCHNSGVVRGLLCTTCNKWLGLYELWKIDRRFDAYLERRPMGQLSETDYAAFSLMLEELAPEVDSMAEVPNNFVGDMIGKNKQYGERMFVSPKQLAWVKKLHEQYVGDTDHAEGDDRDPRSSKDMDDDIPHSDRYHYFRAHNHPFGWGVRDSKTNAVVAMGDKSACAHLALLYNNEPSRFRFDQFADNWDAYYGAPNSAPAYEYNDDGTLTPFKAADRLGK